MGLLLHQQFETDRTCLTPLIGEMTEAMMARACVVAI